MKPFGHLSPRAKLRRLRSLAESALSQYDLAEPSIVYHGVDTNVMYRVSDAAGERYALRLASPGWRTLDDLRSEAMWLDALSRDSSIGAPSVLRARDGRFVVQASTPGVPDSWNVSLMTWVPGRLLGHYLTRQNLVLMGTLFAELHRHGQAWTPPAGFTRRRFEHWLSRGEPNVIVGDEGNPVPVGAARRAIASMDELVARAYQSIDRRDLRVIHCDLWHDNIKLHNGRLHPFDFEDTVLGYRAHDIAMAMLDLLEDTDDVRYPELLDAFRTGYEVGLPWPDDAIEPFQIGRLLWKLNWIARHRPSRLPATVERYVRVFEKYERTGKVARPSG